MGLVEKHFENLKNTRYTHDLIWAVNTHSTDIKYPKTTTGRELNITLQV